VLPVLPVVPVGFTIAAVSLVLHLISLLDFFHYCNAVVIVAVDCGSNKGLWQRSKGRFVLVPEK
jgi:hypothetical protein